MADASDDFDRLLERCRAQLSSITLTLPNLEAEGGPNALPPPPAAAAQPAPAPRPASNPTPEIVSRRREESTTLLHAPAPVAERKEEPAPVARATATNDLPSITAPAPELPPAPPPPAPTTPTPTAAPEPATASSEPLPFDDEDDRMPVEPLRRTHFDLPAAPAHGRTDNEEELPPPPRAQDEKPSPLPRALTRAPKPRSDFPLGWGALALAAAVTAGAVVWRLQRAAPDRTFELTTADAAALRPERSDLLIAAGRRLLDVSEEGRVIDRRSLDAPVASLSWNQGELWSVDRRTRSVVERLEATGRTTTFNLDYVPDAVCARGRYLWTLEGGKTVRQYLVSRSLVGVQLQPLDLYQLPNMDASALSVDDSEILWVTDRTSRRLFRLHVVGPALRTIDSAPLTPWIGSSAEMRALVVDDGDVWLLVSSEDGRAVVHRLKVSRLGWNGA